MEMKRKPFQGVYNIIRFNWHFYVLSLAVIVTLFFLKEKAPSYLQFYFSCLLWLVVITNLMSLLVSFYVYDVSGLYKLNWLNDLKINEAGKFINITAGFDETSQLLLAKFDKANLTVYDFYNPRQHTEISIKRARKVYSPFPGTEIISTDYLPLDNASVDHLFAIFSVHEIRDSMERATFFKELARVLKHDGQIFITEHLRDGKNFFAYNIGFLHFHSYSTWKKTFATAGLQINKEIKITPFVTTFILRKNDSAL